MLTFDAQILPDIQRLQCESLLYMVMSLSSILTTFESIANTCNTVLQILSIPYCKFSKVLQILCNTLRLRMTIRNIQSTNGDLLKVSVIQKVMPIKCNLNIVL